MVLKEGPVDMHGLAVAVLGEDAGAGQQEKYGEG
jgi:hypothetical protein